MSIAPDPMTDILLAAQFSFDETLRAVRDVERAVEYVRAQTPAAVNVGPAIADSAPRGGGVITNEQFVALARCESGTLDDGVNTGGWRTGLYGIEDPRAGQMSPAEQRAYAQDIYNRHGASAWGVGCRGILGG